MKFSLEPINTIKELIRQLSSGLSRLDFINNFEAFEETIVIPATSSYTVRNRLKFIPNRYIITKQVGNGLITADSTDWTREFLYMYNHGASSVTATILFLR